MLKKKEWLKRFKKLLSESGLFPRFDIEFIATSAVLDYKNELSPGEVAIDVIENVEDLLYCLGAGEKC